MQIFGKNATGNPPYFTNKKRPPDGGQKSWYGYGMGTQRKNPLKIKGFRVRETGLEPASTYVHMNLNHARLPIPPFPQGVGRGGFEPPKLIAADLQSAPFGHSGTYPYDVPLDPKGGAGDGTRTRNLLITNQLLCQLSYASTKLVTADPT